MASLTPQQAATRANVSRGTIMNAIKNKDLMARRDNRNRWQISPSDLSNWMTGRPDIVSDNSYKFDTTMLASADEKTIRIAVLEAELKAKDQRISDLEQERDARLENKDRQIHQLLQDRDAQIADIKADRDRWSEHAKQIESNRPRPRWWPF